MRCHDRQAKLPFTPGQARTVHLSEKVDEERAPVCLLLPALDFLMLALLQSSPGHLVTAENGRGTQ